MHFRRPIETFKQLGAIWYSVQVLAEEVLETLGAILLLESIIYYMLDIVLDLTAERRERLQSASRLFARQAFKLICATILILTLSGGTVYYFAGRQASADAPVPRLFKKAQKPKSVTSEGQRSEPESSPSADSLRKVWFEDLVKPLSISKSDQAVLMRFVTDSVLNPKNKEKGLSEINSLVTLLDSDTGLPLAVIDGNWVTAIRTAGLSAVAAKRLARPESSVIAFVGCGVQARSHLRAFSDLFDLQEIRAFNRGAENRDALCRTAESMGLVAHSCDQIEEAIRGADLIVTSVSWSQNTDAFIDAAWVKAGAFASVVDLGVPWIDESMDAFDRIIIDDLAQEAEMEHPMVDLSLVKGDLSGLVTGDVDGRLTKDEKTAFIFRGFALGDLALATLAYQASGQ